jgi:(p)ppGpp synthase/HD superfamily hydrolase
MRATPALVKTMPLHAITEVYGEDGLRLRLELETRALPTDAGELVRRALELAGALHRDDRRTREPYVNHLLRTAIRVMCYYGVDDPDVIAAALLHDTVEDHPAELAGGRTGEVTEAALTTLAERFNPRVADLVRAVTNPPYEPGRDRLEQYREHVATSLAATPWARVIKASDFTDNGVGVIHSAPDKAYRSAAKYAPLVPVLRELVGRPDTPLRNDVKQHIFDQLDLARERFDAILAAPP